MALITQVEKKRRPRTISDAARSIFRKRSSKVGAGMIIFIFLLVVIGTLTIPYAPNKISGPINSPPNSQHIMGTDYLGQDVASQVVWGAFPSMLVSFASSLAAALIGLLVGALGGYYRRLEGFFTGTADVIMTFPAFPLMVLLGLLFYPTTDFTIAIILIIVLWPPVSRAIRSQVLSVKERPFVQAAKISGMGNLEILFRVIIPEITPIAIAYFVLTLSVSLVFVTGLEFLGVGNPEVVSWGSILYWAQQFAFYNGDWWWILAPGLLITVFATAFALIGFSIEEVMNPRLKV
jgi:peptide/nickel transport system permease protein